MLRLSPAVAAVLLLTSARPAIASTVSQAGLPTGDDHAFAKYQEPAQMPPGAAHVEAVLPLPPLRQARLASPFGSRAAPVAGASVRHGGIDLAAPRGTPVHAIADGRVQAAGWSAGYGNLVTLGHGGGAESRYGHLDRLLVLPGEQVHRGQVIGLVGSTGRSTGPHLHYEVRLAGLRVDPLPLFSLGFEEAPAVRPLDPTVAPRWTWGAAERLPQPSITNTPASPGLLAFGAR